MPPTLTHPGVYLQELPSGSRTITGVATAVAAFVGRALRGPVNQPTRITSYAQFERQFGGLWRESGLGYAVRDYYLNGGQQALIVRVPGGATSASFGLDADTGTLSLEAASPGSWGSSLAVSVEHLPDGDQRDAIAAGQGVEAEALFTLTVTQGDPDNPDVVEAYRNVTVVDGPRRLDTVLATSTLVRVDGDLPDEMPDEVANAVPTTAGSDGAALTGTDYASPALETADEGIYALEHADLFTILCLPPSAPSGDLDDDVWSAAQDYCARKRALLLVDPPGAQTSATAISTWLSGLGLVPDGRNGALYYPRIRKADPLRDGALGTFVPSGAIAGVMARTDSARGVWKAPAGLEAGLVGVAGLAVDVTEGDSGALNPLGINALRTFPIIGSVVWGSRTIRGADVLADEYKYVPVRRLSLFLQETLYRNTQWVVFEPNDEPLWSQIRASIGAFMQDLFRQGAFQGSSPREAYLVKCDSETTTQYDIDRGIVNILVAFAPLKPAEFVVISIQQKTAGAAA